MCLKKAAVARTPFDGMFGLIALGGIKKPSYYDYSLLHQLGDERLANAADNILVTRTKDGGLAIAVWNIVDPGTKGAVKNVRLEFAGVPNGATISGAAWMKTMGIRCLRTERWESAISDDGANRQAQCGFHAAAADGGTSGRKSLDAAVGAECIGAGENSGGQIMRGRCAPKNHVAPYSVQEKFLASS